MKADSMSFAEAEQGLLAGDFSRLAPLFEKDSADEPTIVQWHRKGLFERKPEALAEAFSCACFNGFAEPASYFLKAGVDPSGGMKTGMNAFHWAANRGQVEVVRLLIAAKAPMEVRNMYGGTVLGCTVWSALNEPREGQIEVIEALVHAGADVRAVGGLSGNQRIDQILEGG